MHVVWNLREYMKDKCLVLKNLCLFVCLLAFLSLQLVCVDPSGQGRRLCRRVGLSRLQDVAVCWWNTAEPDDEWPWSPVDVQQCNVVLLSCSTSDNLKV